MALIACTECNKEYSNLTKSCPNCGCPTIHSASLEKTQDIMVKPNDYLKQIQNKLKSTNFIQDNYGILLGLLVVDMLFVFFTPTALIAELLMFIACLFTAYMVAKSFFYLTEDRTKSIVFGILSIFTVVNVFFLVYIIYAFNKDKNHTL